MKFAKRVFTVAGIYGLIVILPLYFLEEKIGRDFPPAITHPEFYYGFVGVTLAWQILFLILARDPVRYRAMMIPSVLEKASYVSGIIILFVLGRVSIFTLGSGIMDLIFCLLFLAAYVKTKKAEASR